MSKIIEKYRKEAETLYMGSYSKYQTWRFAILEALFRPQMKVPGKEPMSHLHPNMDKLHFPHGIYMADWRKYRVEDHPALVNFQKRCHAAGLHDPWLRNHAYNFYPNMMANRSRFAFITQGLTFGFVVGGTIFLGEKVYDYYYPMTYIHSKEYLEEQASKGHHH